MKKLTINLLSICIILTFTSCRTFREVESSIFSGAEAATSTTNSLDTTEHDANVAEASIERPEL